MYCAALLMRIKIYPVSSTHPLHQTLLHRRPHNCFSILEVHLSEFVLFRPLPACSIFHLFTKGEVNIPIAESMLVSIPDVSCVTLFPEAFFLQLSDHRIFIVLLPQTNIPTIRALGMPSQAFCPRLALLKMRSWLAALTYELYLPHH